MGNYLSRLKNHKCLGGCNEEELLTQNSLEAVEEIVHTMRRNGRILGDALVFLRTEDLPHQGVVYEYVSAIESGSSRTVRNLLDAGWRIEAVQALSIFISRLEKPLIPIAIQSLVLDDNNHNVPPEIVASDVLGLINEELPRRHKKFIRLILHLLHCSIRFSPADEIRGHRLPISMLPHFFYTIEMNHFTNEWRRILEIFVEVIRQSSIIVT